MAKAAPTPTEQRIDHLLELLTWRWESLPQVEREIDGWDLAEHIDFVEEWPLVERHLAEMKQYASSGLLTPNQADHLGRILELAARNRSIVERLRRS